MTTGTRDIAHVPPRDARAEDGDGEYSHLRPALIRHGGLAAHDPVKTELRDELVSGFLPVAHHMASRYRGRGVDLEDLTQIASLGLIHAIDRFDPERGDAFLAFAIPTIQGELRR